MFVLFVVLDVELVTVLLFFVPFVFEVLLLEVELVVVFVLVPPLFELELEESPELELEESVSEVGS